MRRKALLLATLAIFATSCIISCQILTNITVEATDPPATSAPTDTTLDTPYADENLVASGAIGGGSNSNTGSDADAMGEKTDYVDVPQLYAAPEETAEANTSSNFLPIFILIALTLASLSVLGYTAFIYFQPQD